MGFHVRQFSSKLKLKQLPPQLSPALAERLEREYSQKPAGQHYVLNTVLACARSAS